MTTGWPARRLGWLLLAPMLILVTIASLVPLAVVAWESLHQHDLRLPWLGRPFIGFANFAEAAGDPRFVSSLLRTVLFALVTVPIELAAGTVLALMMHSAVRGRALVRLAVLLPWAVPAVIAALIWRFIFDAQAGIVTTVVRDSGLVDASFDWFVRPIAAWVPIVAADAWKTTPFVAILLLAGLQTIDPSIDEAARMDGAGGLYRTLTITLPLLRPAFIVAAAFRALDALRVFDMVYVLTSGGPGTATEPLSLYTYTVLSQRLRVGYGSALSLTVFLLTFGFALVWVRALGRTVSEQR